jgi:hypothetical protein
MPKKTKKQRTLNEIFYDLAPYFRSLVPDDDSDDFLPVLTVMFPKRWVMLASDKFRPVAQAIGDGAVEYIFKIQSTEVQLEDVVELVEKAIQYNTMHDEKVRALEEEKNRLREKLEEELQLLQADKLNQAPEGVEIVDFDSTLVEPKGDDGIVELPYEEPPAQPINENPHIFEEDPADIDDPYMDQMMADLARKGRSL